MGSAGGLLLFVASRVNRPAEATIWRDSRALLCDAHFLFKFTCVSALPWTAVCLGHPSPAAPIPAPMRMHKVVASPGEPSTPGGGTHKGHVMEEDWSLVEPGHHGAAKHPPGSPRDRRGVTSPSRQKRAQGGQQQLRWAAVVLAITVLPPIMLATYCRLLPRCSPEAVLYCGAQPCRTMSTGAFQVAAS
jgi:hypothetical protein